MFYDVSILTEHFKVEADDKRQAALKATELYRDNHSELKRFPTDKLFNRLRANYYITAKELK
jgi:hypothetical protein